MFVLITHYALNVMFVLNIMFQVSKCIRSLFAYYHCKFMIELMVFIAIDFNALVMLLLKRIQQMNAYNKLNECI